MKPGELEIIHEQHDGVDELLLVGELDLASAGELERHVAMLCLSDGGGREIVLDLARLDFVDSTGLRAMLAARQVCEQSGCSLTLRNCGERVRRVLDLTGMDAVLLSREDGAEGSGDATSGSEPTARGMQ